MSAAVQIRDRITELRRVKASELLPHDQNFRRHPETQLAPLRALIEQIGYADALLAYTEEDGSLRLFDGHARRDLTPEMEVPVLVTDLTAAEARLMLRSLDPLAGLAEADDALLASLTASVNADIEAGLLGADERLDALLKEIVGPPASGLLDGVDPDAIPEAVETRCKAGELWECGAHRVLCGDSTKTEDVGRLLAGAGVSACVTDPPYNVGLDYDDATDDEKGTEGYLRFSRDWWALVGCETRVVTPGWNNLASWLVHFAPQAQGVWTKTNSMTRGSISRFNCWEPILFYGCKNTDRAHDVFDFPTSIHFGGAGSGIADPHPCPKPATFWEELYRCYTDEGAAVYEPFCGSGTGLVVAEATGRRCFAMEHSEHYVDIALTRFERATGKTARRLD